VTRKALIQGWRGSRRIHFGHWSRRWITTPQTHQHDTCDYEFQWNFPSVYSQNHTSSLVRLQEKGGIVKKLNRPVKGCLKYLYAFPTITFTL